MEKQYNIDLEGLDKRDISEQEGLRSKLVNKEISADLYQSLMGKQNEEYYKRMGEINNSTKKDLTDTLDHDIIKTHYMDTDEGMDNSFDADSDDGGDGDD